jgi:hypothetical protein
VGVQEREHIKINYKARLVGSDALMSSSSHEIGGLGPLD